MDGFSAFLRMGGYAAYVWPAFAIVAVVMVAFVVTSLRSLRANQATLRALEEAGAVRPRRARRRDAAQSPEAQT
jgi:heme exporter protein D